MRQYLSRQKSLSEIASLKGQSLANISQKYSRDVQRMISAFILIFFDVDKLFSGLDDFLHETIKAFLIYQHSEIPEKLQISNITLSWRKSKIAEELSYSDEAIIFFLFLNTYRFYGNLNKIILSCLSKGLCPETKEK